MWFNPRNLTNWYLKWPIVLLKPEIYVYIYIHIYIYIYISKKPSFLGIQPLLFEASKPLQLIIPQKPTTQRKKMGTPFTPSAKLHSKKAGVMPKMPPKKLDSKVFWHATYVTLEVRPWKFNSYSIVIAGPQKGKGASSSCAIIFQRWTVQLLECKASFNHPKWGAQQLAEKVAVGHIRSRGFGRGFWLSRSRSKAIKLHFLHW